MSIERYNRRPSITVLEARLRRDMDAAIARGIKIDAGDWFQFSEVRDDEPICCCPFGALLLPLLDDPDDELLEKGYPYAVAALLRINQTDVLSLASGFDDNPSDGCGRRYYQLGQRLRRDYLFAGQS